MSKKRRVFDIDMPMDEAAAPAESTARRGPMATAITENAESLRDRQNLEAQIRAENDALAHEHVRLKQAGLIVDLIPLDAVKTTKLMRDRVKHEDFDLKDLITSIRDIGLSNPIRVEESADGYELIQGFRRLSAYKALLEETGDVELWGMIPAGMVPRGETLQTLYRRMVDENLIRKDISFAEMAALAIDYASDPIMAGMDPEKAVAELYESAGYQKRSYIRAFIKIVEPLRFDLQFMNEIPRSLGVALAGRIDVESGIVAAIKADLKELDNRSIREELDVLRRYAGQAIYDDVGRVVEPAKPALRKPGAAAATKAKTTFEIARPRGKARCVAGAGRLEIKFDRDFSSIDRRKLEGAVRSLLDQID